MSGIIVIDGDIFPTTFSGLMSQPNSSMPHLLSAQVSTKVSGEFTVTVVEKTGDGMQTHLLGSPFTIVVDPAETDAASCKSISPSSVIAGEDFEIIIQMFEEYENNPTDSGRTDEFLGWAEGETATKLTIVLNPEASSYYDFVFSGMKTIAGINLIHVKHIRTNLEVANSPFAVRILPSIPNALATSHNLESNKLDTSDKVDFLLQVYPSDEYNNLLSESATGYSVTLIAFGLEQTFLLEAPAYSITYPITQDFEGTLVVSFFYNGDEIKNSPLTISCSSSALTKEENIRILIIVVVSFFIMLFVGALLFFRFRRDAKVRHYMVEQAKTNSERRSNIDIQEMGEMKRKSERLAKVTIEENKKEIAKLNDELKRKVHTEEELRIMKDAFADMSKQHSNELREVIVAAKDVTIISLLGKGGSGTVHLGTFKGGQVAVKQLIRLTKTSVFRFRFECFLMKNLRHPNVVKLVGVCWEVSMLACLLEYMPNGDLQTQLTNDFKRPRDDVNKLTWRGNLYKMMLDAALGVQYLHNSRYFDPVDNEWRDVIIHRDLKPANMLITNDYDLKLTDFGEARAIDLDLTMTYVG